MVWFRPLTSGTRRLEATYWILQRNDTTHAIISGHVDDFMMVGDPEDEVWTQARQQLQARFRWGEFEVNKFTQCGVQVRKEGSDYILSQERYIDGVKEIPVSSERRKKRKDPTTDAEKRALRGLLGAMSWHVSQVAFRFAAHVSLALSDVCNSTVE